MPKTIQIRDLDDDVYAGLVRRAGEHGLSVPELLRQEATRLAAQPTAAAWLRQIRTTPSPAAPVDAVHALDEQRGPWPDAGR